MTPVPYGSLWRVLGLTGYGGDTYTLHALVKPVRYPWRNTVFPVEEHSFPPGTIITVGDTVDAIDNDGPWLIPFVRVLTPRCVFINRVLFNEGSIHLARVT